MVGTGARTVTRDWGLGWDRGSDFRWNSGQDHGLVLGTGHRKGFGQG